MGVRDKTWMWLKLVLPLGMDILVRGCSHSEFLREGKFSFYSLLGIAEKP